MILTKQYFKNFQYFVVGLCIFSAVFIGSIQTALIIFNVSRAKK